MMRQEYKSLGYRLQTTEPLMIHSCKRSPFLRRRRAWRFNESGDRSWPIGLAKVARARQIFPHHFEDEEVRQYIAMDGRELWDGAERGCPQIAVVFQYARAERVSAAGDGAGDAVTDAPDDRDNGCKANVLTAAMLGAKLYRRWVISIWRRCMCINCGGNERGSFVSSVPIIDGRIRLAYPI